MALVREGVALMGAPGFDDAPIVHVTTGMPKLIQFVYPYYENPIFLAKQLDMWHMYPQLVKDNIRAIIVDDGSPLTPAVRVLRGCVLPFPIRLFRIDVDVRWNWLAARNIGMKHSQDGWCVMTDMDHVIDSDTAIRLVLGKYNENVIYRFSRRESSGAPIHPHPNSMLMIKRMFWKVGGYDEALSGHYGTDGDWRRRCAAKAKIQTLRDELVRYEYVDDSSTTGYKRKQLEDAGKKAIIAQRKSNWRPKTLSFPYHEEML